MSVLVGVAGAALLFVVFGLLRLGRGHDRCAGCAGGCASDEHCHTNHSSRRETDEPS